MKLSKEQIGSLNALAQMNWEQAHPMLDGVNLLSEIEYRWLNKRVTFVGEDGLFHDAWAWAENGKM